MGVITHCEQVASYPGKLISKAARELSADSHRSTLAVTAHMRGEGAPQPRDARDVSQMLEQCLHPAEGTGTRAMPVTCSASSEARLE